jgi:hypothetical protein
MHNSNHVPLVGTSPQYVECYRVPKAVARVLDEVCQSRSLGGLSVLLWPVCPWVKDAGHYSYTRNLYCELNGTRDLVELLCHWHQCTLYLRSSILVPFSNNNVATRTDFQDGR